MRTLNSPAPIPLPRPSCFAGVRARFDTRGHGLPRGRARAGREALARWLRPGNPPWLEGWGRIPRSCSPVPAPSRLGLCHRGRTRGGLVWTRPRGLASRVQGLPREARGAAAVGKPRAGANGKIVHMHDFSVRVERPARSRGDRVTSWPPEASTTPGLAGSPQFAGKRDAPQPRPKRDGALPTHSRRG